MQVLWQFLSSENMPGSSQQSQARNNGWVNMRRGRDLVVVEKVFGIGHDALGLDGGCDRLRQLVAEKRILTGKVFKVAATPGCARVQRERK